MSRARALLSLSATLLAFVANVGCAAAKPRDKVAPGATGATSQAAPSAEPAPPADGGVVLGKLANPVLPAGSCGMLVWMLDGGAPIPVFRYVAGAGAQISVAGKNLELVRIESLGTVNFGISERQKFTSGAGLTLEINAEFGSPFEGGVWLQNGVVAIESADGWRSVAPIAGVAGCRQK